VFVNDREPAVIGQLIKDRLENRSEPTKESADNHQTRDEQSDKNPVPPQELASLRAKFRRAVQRDIEIQLNDQNALQLLNALTTEKKKKSTDSLSRRLPVTL